ncbi:MAG TPA: hypothetical protein EYP34_01765 [Chromatiaceae bacterium]|nr:hypothetical protein [Chromatiaceae bacterium]
MTKLAELLKHLGSEAELAASYEKDPKKVMQDAGLSRQEMELLEKGDLKLLEEATGLGNLKKINIIIKAYDE